MKLGICYMVFDGSELLEFAISSIRKHVDFISATYQTTSYFGNKADDYLVSNMERLVSSGMIDKLIHFEPDLKVHHKINELNLRNIGLKMSREAGCTHHISADVDEFYESKQLEYAKGEIGDCDFSIAEFANYYKDPTFLIVPDQKQQMSFIHPVRNSYEYTEKFPFKIEITRRFSDYGKYRVFSKDEMTVHHMSYVRRDIRRKLANSDNGRFYKRIDKFVEDFDKYKLGDRLRVVPDFMNRKTVFVENIFGIKLEG